MATRGGAFRASHPPTPHPPAPQRKVTLGLRDLRVFFPRFPWASMARGVRGAGSLGEAEVQEDTHAIPRPSLTLALCASPIARAPRCARGWPREKALPSDLPAQPHLRGTHLVFAHQLGSDLMLLAGVPMVACLTPNPLPWGPVPLLSSHLTMCPLAAHSYQWAFLDGDHVRGPVLSSPRRHGLPQFPCALYKVLKLKLDSTVVDLKPSHWPKSSLGLGNVSGHLPALAESERVESRALNTFCSCS